VEPGTHTSDHGGSSDPETRESRRLWEKPEISGPQRHDETAGLGHVFELVFYVHQFHQCLTARNFSLGLEG